MRLTLGKLTVCLLALSGLAAAQIVLPSNCGIVNDTGNSYLFCPVPSKPNAPLVVYAHGYVAPDLPVGIPFDQLVLPDGTFIPSLVNQLGYAFAAPSFPENGFAFASGLASVLASVARYGDFPTTGAQSPQRVYVVGVSEGAVVAAKAVESHADVFAGGMALCGPIGDFKKQVNYIGDFRAVFDYFYPGLLPGSPVSMDSAATMRPQWDAIQQTIRQAASSAPLKFLQVYNVGGTPLTLADVPLSAVNVLWYNIFGTADAIAKLGGDPYGNQGRVYSGSLNDLLLNLRIKRYTQTAGIPASFQTTGILSKPLVTMHTTSDPLVPYWHTTLYAAKVAASRSGANYVNVPVLRYGHCNFNQTDVLIGFGLMVTRSGGSVLSTAGALPEPTADR